MRRDVSQKKVAKARFIVLLLSIGVKWPYNLYKIIDFPNAIHSRLVVSILKSLKENAKP